ncbi:MAG: efflux RND transporter periplasmic adaptor subunit [Planctomycetota bacterium]|nr:MAG: efflux RND transporter periplasmic adaptor subunit [Planctomycetota bacterium]
MNLPGVAELRLPHLPESPMAKFLLRLILGLAAIGACYLGWYVVYQDAQAKAAAAPKVKPNDTLAVETAHVKRAAISDRIELVGSLTPHAEVAVRPRIGGYVRSLTVDLGDPVTIGQELARLDDQNQLEAVAQVAAALDVANAQVAVQKTEQELARKNWERQKKLLTDGGGTTQQVEQAQAAYDIATARITLEEAKVAQANSDLLRSKIVLDELRLLSPMAGVVAQRMIDVGNLAAPDAALLRIVDLSTVRTTVHVIERDYRRMRLGLDAEVRVDAYPNLVFRGQVARVAPVLDELTRTADIRIDVVNTDGLLKPGMYGRVSLRSGSEREGLVIPVTALIDGQRPAVYLPVGNPPRAERRSIEIGMVDGEIVEVLKGLSAGDEVITLGNRLIIPGQLVLKRPLEAGTESGVKTAAE